MKRTAAAGIQRDITDVIATSLPAAHLLRKSGALCMRVDVTAPQKRVSYPKRNTAVTKVVQRTCVRELAGAESGRRRR